MVTHTNKQVGKGIEAIDRIMGSVAWASTARIALGFAPDPQDPKQCLFAGIKSNLGPKAKTLAYSIKPTDSLAVIEWYGEVDISADEAFNGDGKKGIRESIDSFMEERFREKRRWLSKDIEDHAKHAGFSFNVIKTYKKGIDKKHVDDENGVRSWWWIARPGWPEVSLDVDSGNKICPNLPESTSIFRRKSLQDK